MYKRSNTNPEQSSSKMCPTHVPLSPDANNLTAEALSIVIKRTQSDNNLLHMECNKLKTIIKKMDVKLRSCISRNKEV